MAKILILDGHCNAALAFTRSLGRAGHWIVVGHNQGQLAPAAFSRYCHQSFEYPISTHEPENFAEAVLKFVRETRIDLLAPMTDWTTFPLVQRQEKFSSLVRLAVPPLRALEIVSDKYRTIALARQLEVPVPETLFARTLDDLEPARGWPYPVVVKDRFSVRWLDDRVVLGSASYAYSWDDLRRQTQQRLEKVGDVLVQKFVVGVGTGFSCFVAGGKPHLPFQWQRVREENPCGGASSTRKSVALHPQVLESGKVLMARSGFQGIGMVEFKFDAASGRLCLMEINGRPWGSLQLAVESGIDYPRYVAEWFLQASQPPERIKYKEQITCRRFVGDLDHLARLRKGRPPGWPGMYPDFWATLLKVSIPWYPNLRYEDLCLRDLKPGLAELRQWVMLRLTKGVGMGRKNSSRRSPGVDGRLVVRGIVHSHTTVSYDGKVSLSDLCKALRQQGFSFVALTEHTRGLSPKDYEELVRNCREVSGKDFIAIPGLEFRCGNGLEVAGLGVQKWIEDGTPDQVVTRTRELVGFTIWVHPWRNGRWGGPFPNCDAVEVLNLKLDGTLAPNLSLLRWTVQKRKAGKRFFAIFGVDFHDVSQPLTAWVECQVHEFTPEAILTALREGQFVSCVPYATVSSTGAAGIKDHALMLFFRIAFLVWAGFLRRVPIPVRKAAIALSRPVISLVRGVGQRNCEH